MVSGVIVWLLFGSLGRQFFGEGRFFFVHVGFETGGVYKWIRAALFKIQVFRLQTVERSVRTQEDVHGERTQDLEAARVVVGDGRIVLVPDQHVAGVDADAAY